MNQNPRKVIEGLLNAISDECFGNRKVDDLHHVQGFCEHSDQQNNFENGSVYSFNSK